jgi:hypothetical protein
MESHNPKNNLMNKGVKMRRVIILLALFGFVLLFSCSQTENSTSKLGTKKVKSINGKMDTTDVNSGVEETANATDSIKTNTPEKVESTKEVAVKQQCRATTKKGKRCSRMTDDPSGYCYQHK